MYFVIFYVSCFLSLVNLLSHFHIASCAALFAPRAGPTFPAMYFHPSTSTGNPRSRQNAAVIHVNTCAPTRIMACTSAAHSPTPPPHPRATPHSHHHIHPP